MHSRAYSVPRTSRLFRRSGRTHESSARERAGVGGTGPPRGGHCPYGSSPGRGRDRWGGVGEVGRRPSPHHAVGRCAQEVRRHGPVAGRGRDAALGRVEKSREGSTGSEGADLDTKNRGVCRLRSRDREVPCRGGVAGGREAGCFLAVLRAQRRQAGLRYSWTLRRLPHRTVRIGVLLSVAVVMALRLLARRLRRRGTRNVFVFGSVLEMNARRRNTLVGGEVTHRRVRADGMRIQQAEEEQAKPQHTPQSR